MDAYIHTLIPHQRVRMLHRHITAAQVATPPAVHHRPYHSAPVTENTTSASDSRGLSSSTSHHHHGADRGLCRSGRIPTCFDVFASVWVHAYELAVPSALEESKRHLLIGELHSSTAKLRQRRTELGQRLLQSLREVKRSHSKSGAKAVRSQMPAIRRLKGQIDRLDSSLSVIETNIDEIVNSDVTKDIITSLKRFNDTQNIHTPPFVTKDFIPLLHYYCQCRIPYHYYTTTANAVLPICRTASVNKMLTVPIILQVHRSHAGTVGSHWNC